MASEGIGFSLPLPLPLRPCHSVASDHDEPRDVSEGKQEKKVRVAGYRNISHPEFPKRTYEVLTHSYTVVHTRVMNGYAMCLT